MSAPIVDEAACGHLLRAVLGKPWVPRAAGPDAWDCYTLLQHADWALFGRRLPPYPAGVAATSPKAVAAAIASDAYYRRLRRVQEPSHGDYAELCSSDGRPVHVGLWLAAGRGGGLLHCERGRGVCFDAPTLLRRSGYAIRFLRTDAA